MLIGISLALCSAVLLGNYALPSKYAKGFSWDHVWGGFFFFGMVVIPIVVTFAMVGDLWEIYGKISGWVIPTMLALSFFWGIGNILWGYSIASIGMALAFSLFLGVITSIDTLLPLLLVPEGQESVIGTRIGTIILLGIATIVSGIAINGYAGVLRDREKTGETATSDSRAVRRGIFCCVLGAVFAAGFNLAYHVGNNLGGIGEIAEMQFGYAPWVARLAVLFPIFMGAALSTMVFFVFRITKAGSWGNYTGKYALLGVGMVAIMAVFHDAALLIYGLAAYHLGELGTSVGFAILETGAIVVATANGILTKEWHGTSARSRKTLAVSLAVVIFGVLIVARANYLKVAADEEGAVPATAHGLKPL